MKKFVLRVWYGTGSDAILVDTPDLVVAIEKFKEKYCAGMPQTKEYGMPEIIKAELTPLMYDSPMEG